MSEFAAMLTEFLIPVIGSAVAWLLGQAGRLAQAKIKQTYVQGVLVRLSVAAEDAVRSIEQTVVKQIQAAQEPGSPGGTKITPEEAAKVRRAALIQLKLFLGKKGLAELAKVLGLPGSSVDHFLEQKIEAEVNRLKRPT